VVTTYETLSSDLRMYEKQKTKDKYPAASKVNWFRIVLDESHKGKSKNSMSTALFGLWGKRRWCVTGTPVNMNLTDFAGQFRVLGMPVVCDTSWWKCMMLKDAREKVLLPQIDKLIAAIGTANNKSKDKDFLAKLEKYSLPQLLDLAKSSERRARA
jgi:SNF2 family DNA or RNA helicase